MGIPVRITMNFGVIFLAFQLTLISSEWCFFREDGKKDDSEGGRGVFNNELMRFKDSRQEEEYGPVSSNYTTTFSAPTTRTYIATLTAQLRPFTPEARQRDLFSYAQLFLLKNGRLTLKDHYLLVESQKVGDMVTTMSLKQGDILSVFVGKNTESIGAMNLYNGQQQQFHGGWLEYVKFCIF